MSHGTSGTVKFSVLTAVVVILIASLFRFFRLADLPLGIFFDPAINGLDAVRLMQFYDKQVDRLTEGVMGLLEYFREVVRPIIHSMGGIIDE